MEMCRSCLSRDKNMMPLYKTFINGYNLLTNLNIELLDGLPQSVCKTCVNSVEKFCDFREQCIQSESSLQQKLLKNSKNEPDQIENNEINENTFKSSSEKSCDRISKNESNLLCKRPRGRPRKIETTSKTKNQRTGHIRKNKAIPEVQKKENPLLEFEIYANSEELSQQIHSCDLDIVKEEIKYEYIEDGSVIDNSLYLGGNLKDLDNDVKEDVPVKGEDLSEQQKQLKTTKSSVVNETNFPCGLCRKLFETHESVSFHLENHKNDSECEICHAPFPEWPGLLAHRMEHVHSKNHQCHLCLKRLYSVETLEYHYLSKHSDKKDIKLSCKLCAKAFTTPRKLQKHKKNVHAEQKYICDHCSKPYSTRSSLQTHLQQHSEVNKYVCFTCGFSSKRSTNLKTHILRSHTATRVNCAACRRVFPDSEASQKHKCSGGAKICSVCGKMFATPDCLKSHMQTHSDLRKYKCELCPATFKTRYSYVDHGNRHKGYRAYACPHCPQRFYAVQHLIRHNRIHTGERPYVCKVCSKAFYNNHSLKLHMKVHGENLIVHRNNKELDNLNNG